MTCSDEHSIKLREYLIQLVGKEMRNPDNKDFYREDLVTDLDNTGEQAESEGNKVRAKGKVKGWT